MLNLFKNNNSFIRWDKRGILFPPYHNLNILQIIKSLTSSRVYIDKKLLPVVGELVSLIRLEPRFIKNHKARKQLLGGFYVKKTAEKKPLWLAY